MSTTISFDQFLNVLFYVSMAGALVTSIAIHVMKKKSKD